MVALVSAHRSMILFSALSNQTHVAGMRQDHFKLQPAPPRRWCADLKDHPTQPEAGKIEFVISFSHSSPPFLS
jgi:hypothetical protein